MSKRLNILSISKVSVYKFWHQLVEGNDMTMVMELALKRKTNIDVVRNTTKRILQDAFDYTVNELKNAVKENGRRVELEMLQGAVQGLNRTVEDALKPFTWWKRMFVDVVLPTIIIGATIFIGSIFSSKQVDGRAAMPKTVPPPVHYDSGTRRYYTGDQLALFSFNCKK